MGTVLYNQLLPTRRVKLDEKTPSIVKKFFYSYYYIIILATASILGWALDEPLISFTVISVLGTILFITVDDVSPAFALILFAVSSIFQSTDLSGYMVCIPVLVPMVVALVFHLFYYRKKWHIGKMAAPQLAIFIAMLFGGLGSISPNQYMNAFGYMMALGLGVLVLYLLFFNYYKQNPYVNTLQYVAKILVVWGIVVVIETIVFYVRMDTPPINWGSINVDVGWSVSNNLAAVLTLTGPLCLYLALASKYTVFYMIICVFQYIGLFLTFSRGGILFGVIAAIPMIIAFYILGRRRKQVWITSVICVVALLAFYFPLQQEINDAVSSLFAQGISLSGREDLFVEAWQEFCKNPIFGTGMGFEGIYYDMDIVPFYWFHSTFFQVLANMGLVGIFTFGWFYFRRYKIFFKNIKRNMFSIFFIFSMLGFELYAMIDTATFVPMPFMLMLIIINVFVEKDSCAPQSNTVYGLTEISYKRENEDDENLEEENIIIEEEKQEVLVVS